MLVLMTVLIWAVPHWLPAGGLVIRVGPWRAAADQPVAVASGPDPARPVAVAPSTQPSGSTPPAGATPPAAVESDTPAVTAAPLPHLAPGQLLVPVQGIRPDQLVDTYTQARGQGRVHDAIDIAAPRGTPVLATGDGMVLKLFQSDRGGITLYELAPDRRTIYYYAHLDRYAPGMAEGRPLKRGDVLGYVGNTGNAGAGNYHLHFEVSTTADPKRYWAGTPQNPFPLLRGGTSQP